MQESEKATFTDTQHLQLLRTSARDATLKSGRHCEITQWKIRNDAVRINSQAPTKSEMAQIKKRNKTQLRTCEDRGSCAVRLNTFHSNENWKWQPRPALKIGALSSPAEVEPRSLLAALRRNSRRKIRDSGKHVRLPARMPADTILEQQAEAQPSDRLRYYYKIIPKIYRIPLS